MYDELFLYFLISYIRSEHVIRILLAFGHQGFPSAFISDWNIVPSAGHQSGARASSLNRSSSGFLCKICKMFSPVAQLGLGAASSRILRCEESWITENVVDL